MTRLELIRIWQGYLSGLGLPSFPLWGITNGKCRCSQGADCSQPGKHPKISGWRTLTGPVEVGALDNLGVSTDNLVVVDVDLPVIPDDLPETFTVSTGRGFHLWYWANPDYPIRNRTSWRPKVDIRAVGGLVAAPPSRHYLGHTYEYTQGEIRPVPDFILKDHERHTARQKKDAVTEVPDSTDDSILPLVENLLAEVENAPNGERNATLFRVACRLMDLARTGWVGGDSIQALISSAERAGLTRQEAARTIESATRA